MTPEQIQAAQQAYRRVRGSLSPGQLQVDPSLQQAPEAPTEAAPMVQPPSAISPNVAPRAGLANAMNEMADTTQQQVQSAQAVGQARAQGADERARILGDYDTESQQAGQESAGRIATHQQHADQAFAKAQELEQQAANTRIEVDRRTPGQKVGGIVAQALAGIGDAMAAYGGREQHAADAIVNNIQADIDRDVAMQREALADKRKAAAAKYTEYGLAMGSLRDERQASAFADAARKDKYAVQLDRVASMAEGNAQRAAITGAAAKLREDAASKRAGIYQELELQRQRTQAAIAGAQARGQVLTPEMILRLTQDARNERRDPRAAAEVMGNQLTEDLRVRDPRIAVLHAGTAEKMQTTIDAAKTAVGTIDRILQKRTDNPVMRGIPLTQANDELKSDNESLNIALKTIFDLGVLNGPDMGILERAKGDATSFGPSADSRMRSLRTLLEEKVGRAIHARGFDSPFKLRNAPAADASGPKKSDATGNALGSVAMPGQKAGAQGPKAWKPGEEW